MPELWLKNRKVLAFEEQRGAVVKIKKVFDARLLPIGIPETPTVENINEWLQRRGIPASRDGLKDIVAKFGEDWLISKNRLSLTDQYWIRKRDETWNSVNYFTNRYSTDVGDLFFRPWDFNKKKIDNDTPDVTTNGLLRKRWRQQQDKTSLLIKSSNKATHQEPLSEVLVSILLEKLKIAPFVRYDFTTEGGLLCSKSKNFITPDTELVPVSAFYYTDKREDGESIYQHIIKECDKLGIPGMEEYLDVMIFIDCLTGNSDRNLGNICVLRNIENMEFIGPAPLFDFAASYWSAEKINHATRSKTFKSIEKKICSKMKKRADVERVLKDTSHEAIIEAYPDLLPSRKQELIGAISERSDKLLNGRFFGKEERDLEL